MDKQPAATLEEDRPISTDEAAIVTWMLLHASVAGSLDHLASSVPLLRVVGRCACGCGSVDFEVNGQTLPFHPIVDATGQNSVVSKSVFYFGAAVRLSPAWSFTTWQALQRERRQSLR